MDIQGHIIDHWVEKMLDHLAKLPDVRFLSSEEREKYDESIKAADDYYGVLMSYYMNGIDEGVAKGEARGSHHKSLEIAKKMMAKPKIRLKPKSVSKLIYLSSTCFIIICIKNPCHKVTTLFSNPQEISVKSL